MAIASMGVHSALETVQIAEPEYRTIVEALTTADRSSVKGAPTTAMSNDPMVAALEKISVWIPAETLALWLLFVASFNVFSDSLTELILGVVTVIVSGVYGFFSSTSAHARRGYSRNRRKAWLVAIMASGSFFIYWMATPGSISTADWHLQPILTVGVATLTALFLPFIATALKIEAK